MVGSCSGDAVVGGEKELRNMVTVKVHSIISSLLVFHAAIVGRRVVARLWAAEGVLLAKPEGRRWLVIGIPFP